MAFFLLINLGPVLGAECTTAWLANHTYLYYKLEENALNYSDATNHLKFTSADLPTRTTGKISYGQDFEDADFNWLNTTKKSVLEKTQFTWNFWIKPESYPAVLAAPFMYSYQSGTTYYGGYLSYYSPGYLDFVLYKGAGSTNIRTITSGTRVLKTGKWQMITVNYDGNNSEVYINGTQVESYSTKTGGVIAYNSGNHALTLGAFGATTYNLDGVMDEISFYDDDLNSTCMQFLYGSGSPGVSQQFPFAAFDAGVRYPNATRHYKVYNGSFIINGTSLMKCQVNDTNWTLMGSSPSLEFEFYNPTTLSERVYSIYWNCTRNGTALTDNGVVNITIDTTFPYITFNSPANHSKIAKNFTIEIMFSDIYLYGTNVSIYQVGNSTPKLTNQSINATGTWTNYLYTQNIDSSKYLDGDFQIIAIAADTHTDEKWNEIAAITEKVIQVDEERVTLEPVSQKLIDGEKIGITKETTFSRDSREKELVMALDYGDIKLSYPENMEIIPIKTADRYVFDHQSKERYGDTYEIIEADKIVVLENSPFPGHLVLNDKYWYDAAGLPGAEIAKISDNKYIILWTKTEEKITSHSLGGLNVNNKTLFFSVDQTSPTLLKNITLSYGNGANIWVNVSENVTYNLTVTRLTCTGNKVKTQLNNTFAKERTIKVRHLNLSTLYYARVQFKDDFNNNRTYCLNFTTGTEEIKLLNYSFSIFAGTLRLSVIGKDYGDHPFFYNWTLYKNSIKINESDHGNYFNVSEASMAVKPSVIGYLANDIKANRPLCLERADGTVLVRLLSDNLGGVPDKRVAVECADDSGWGLVSNMSWYFNIYHYYLEIELDNGTSINLSLLNSSYTGSWINISAVLDDNNSTFSSCTGGFDDCYVSFTYSPNYLKRRYYSDIEYGLINLTNVTSGKYNVVLNLFDGNYTSSTYNLSYNITFTAQIFDEQTGKLIDNLTANITFISENPDAFLTFTTTTGVGQIEGLVYADYNIIYEAPGYERRHYYLGRDELNLNGTLDLFLLKQDVNDFAIIKVLDQNLQPIEGAIVKVLKNIPNFDSKQIISILQQNFEGESTLDFVFYTDDYQFEVYYGGVLVKTSEFTQVSKQTINIQVPLDDDSLAGLIAYSSTYASGVTITNGTTTDKICSFTYQGKNIRYGCIRVYGRSLMENDVEICESCSYNTSGLLTCGFNMSENVLYYCQGIIDTNTSSSEHLADEAFISLATGRNVLGLIGVFVSFLIIFVLVFAFREHPAAMILMLNIGIIISMVTGLMSWPFGGVIMIFLIGGYFIMRWEQ